LYALINLSKLAIENVTLHIPCSSRCTGHDQFLLVLSCTGHNITCKTV